jgi:hypothetical protein
LPAEELWRAKGYEMKKTTKVATVGVVSARRRLIRGAFAAPTALTLYSGNVFATSSNLRALANQHRDAQWPVAEANPSDTWIRVEVFKVGETGVEVVKRDEVLMQPGCGVDLEFVFDKNGLARADGLSDPIPEGQLATAEKFAALRYDKDGYIVGVSTGEEVPDTTALTRSAGASIAVGGACH